MTANKVPHDDVTKSANGKEWLLRRLDQYAVLGRFKTKQDAIKAGKLLAGWRGFVTLDGWNVA